MQTTSENYLDHCDAARAALDDLIARQEGNASREVSHAVRCIVQARDRLIEERRNGASADQSRQALVQINALLSLMASVEFPLAGVHWPRLKQAREVLEKMGASAGGSGENSA